MMGPADFDLAAAHRYFSAHCFNKAWELIEKPNRSPAEDEEMLLLSLASHWHWMQRPDYSRSSASIGYWQTSRIYALLGHAENARRYGQLCLAAGQESDAPFLLCYAHEALARAESAAGNQAQVEEHLRAARQTAEKITDEQDRQQLLADLSTIKTRKAQ